MFCFCWYIKEKNKFLTENVHLAFNSDYNFIIGKLAFYNHSLKIIL